MCKRTVKTHKVVWPLGKLNNIVDIEIDSVSFRAFADGFADGFAQRSQKFLGTTEIARPDNAAPDQTKVLEHGWTEGSRAE